MDKLEEMRQLTSNYRRAYIAWEPRPGPEAPARVGTGSLQSV